MRSRKRNIDATGRLPLSPSGLRRRGPEPPAALMSECSAGSRAARKGRENFSEGRSLFQILQKTQALPGFASSLGTPPEPRPVHGPQGQPIGGGPNRQGGRNHGNDENPALPVHREQLPEPQGAGGRIRARPQHRGERADHAAHRGGRRRGIPARRGAPPHRRLLLWP